MELAADSIDPEAKGFGPPMVDSVERVELGDTSTVGEVPADRIHYEMSTEGGFVPELSVIPATDDVSDLSEDSASRPSSVGRPTFSRAVSNVSAVSRASKHTS